VYLPLKHLPPDKQLCICRKSISCISAAETSAAGQTAVYLPLNNQL